MNKTILTLAIGCSLAIGITSCSKDKPVTEQEPTLIDNSSSVNESKVAPQKTEYFFNAGKNAVSEKAQADFSFSGSMGLDLKPADAQNYRLAYFTSSVKNISDVKLAVLDTAKFQFADVMTMGMIKDATSAPSVANNWFLYNSTTHVLSPSPNKYIVLLKKDAPFSHNLDKVVVVKLADIKVDNTTRSISEFTFQTKVFTKPVRID